MTDDEIVEAIDRRFAGVETRLPPTRVPGAAGARVRGRTVAGRAFRSMAVPILGLLLIGTVGAGILSSGSPSPPGAAPRATGSSDPIAHGSPSAFPSPSPAVSPSPQPLLVLRGSVDGGTLLAQHFGWGPTLCGGDGSIVALDGTAVDRAVDDTGGDGGWIEVPLPSTRQPTTVRVWVGPTPESAALAHGSRILAIGGRGDTWIVLGSRGWQIVPFRTPKDRTFWVLTGTIADGNCGSASR